jgi:hypothetical protein
LIIVARNIEFFMAECLVLVTGVLRGAKIQTNFEGIADRERVGAAKLNLGGRQSAMSNAFKEAKGGGVPCSTRGGDKWAMEKP